MEPVTQEQNVQESVHDFNAASPSAGFSLTNKVLIIFFGAIVLGVLSGFFLSRNGSTSPTGLGATISSANITKGAIIGSNDTKTFKDQAEGIVKRGGIDGEGAFHLVRPGGESQNVYMTSSAVDLASLVDRKVKVWGQTQKAQHAGWLMDVGKVEVLE